VLNVDFVESAKHLAVTVAKLGDTWFIQRSLCMLALDHRTDVHETVYSGRT